MVEYPLCSTSAAPVGTAIDTDSNHTHIRMRDPALCRCVTHVWAVASGLGLGQMCSDVPEDQTLTLTCPGSAVIDAITFASFGTPTGSCGVGFVVNKTCNAANTSAVVEKLCIGKSTCSIDVSRKTFKQDPCFGVRKVLAVEATCKVPQGAPVFQYKVTVPVGSIADVVVPTFGMTSVTVAESGVPVWENGAYKPGPTGITGAVAANADIRVTIGSGTYVFTVGGTRTVPIDQPM
eukprot:m.133318 g.133318  ORF g.133318 m.133318 type:complete len:235 (+) comp17537_c1_seq1:509-1213(+)